MTVRFDPWAGGALAEFAVAHSTSSRCHVLVECTSHLNQRWARSSLTTNGIAVDLTVTAIAFDERPDGIATASVTESVQDLDGIRSVVDAADAAALAAAPAEDASAYADPAVSDDFDAPAQILPPTHLAGATGNLGELIGWAAAAGVELFGYLERESTTLWLATSDGTRLRHCAPSDRLEITAKSHQRTRSTWHGFASAELPEHQWHGLRTAITAELAWQGNTIVMPPARRTTVLPASAVGDFAIDLYWSSGARDAVEGRSAFHDDASPTLTKLGRQVADRRIHLSSDPGDAIAPGMPFAEAGASGRMSSVFDNGRRLATTDWIRAGNLHRLIATTADAGRLGVPSAPVIDTIRLEIEDDGSNASSPLDLVSGVDDGLLLTCVWYNRTVDPQTMLLTGLTRDGVYVIRGGEIIGATSNFRFNDSPLSMLNRITAATPSTRTLPREMADYASNVVMPSAVVSDMNFTSTSDAR